MRGLLVLLLVWFGLAISIGAAYALRPPPAPLIGLVTRVLDGDTFDMQTSTGLVRVRLYGIDAPETRQPYGPEAAHALRQLLLGQTVLVRPTGRDRNRVIGETFLSTGEPVSLRLVAEGLAWWYVAYAPHDGRLGSLEQTARSQHLGLWASAAPVPPWIWRRQQRCP